MSSATLQRLEVVEFHSSSSFNLISCPGMPTLVVAPVRNAGDAEGIEGLQVPVEINGAPFAVMIAELAHLPARLLGKAMANLADHEYEIRRALERLFSGF